MQIQATIGSKYQVVIPKEARKKLSGLRPGAKVSIHVVDKNTVTLNTDPKDWINRTYGMMKESWKNIDPIAEVEKARDEWEERLKELEKIR